jgi:hypothetical protein
MGMNVDDRDFAQRLLNHIFDPGRFDCSAAVSFFRESDCSHGRVIGTQHYID